MATKSRPVRWAEAVKRAQELVSQIEALGSELEDAMSELRGIQEEYENWKENMSENLANSPTGEKLEEVAGIAIEDAAQPILDAVSELNDVLGEAEAIDLPRGFGRD